MRKLLNKMQFWHLYPALLCCLSHVVCTQHYFHLAGVLRNEKYSFYLKGQHQEIYMKNYDKNIWWWLGCTWKQLLFKCIMKKSKNNKYILWLRLRTSACKYIYGNGNGLTKAYTVLQMGTFIYFCYHSLLFTDIKKKFLGKIFLWKIKLGGRVQSHIDFSW
jgi:hypothetical protein